MEAQFFTKAWVSGCSRTGGSLSSEILICHRCDRYLYSLAVPPEGDTNAELVLHGVSPGKKEMETGRPFSPEAPGGRMLGAYLGLLGFPREKCYITNTVFCGQPKDRLPTFDESRACMFWKWFEYSSLKKIKGVVLMGNDAVRQVLGAMYASLVQTNGKIIDLELGGRTVKTLLLYHPGYVLRKPKLRIEVSNALLRYKEVLNAVG